VIFVRERNARKESGCGSRARYVSYRDTKSTKSKINPSVRPSVPSGEDETIRWKTATARAKGGKQMDITIERIQLSRMRMDSTRPPRVRLSIIFIYAKCRVRATFSHHSTHRQSDELTAILAKSDPRYPRVGRAPRAACDGKGRREGRKNRRRI